MALRRHSLEGFWDRSQAHGEPQGSGTAFQEAMSKFAKRQARLSEVGVWRNAPTPWKKNKGTYVDRDWAIIDF